MCTLSLPNLVRWHLLLLRQKRGAVHLAFATIADSETLITHHCHVFSQLLSDS